MSTENETSKRVDGQNKPWLLLSGSILIGLALALLLFGNELWDRQDQASSATLPQIPVDTTPEAKASGLANSRLVEVGDTAPDLDLEDLDGTRHRLNDFRGRPVIINFWATWCAPCRVEMPELQNAFEQHQEDGLVVLAVNYDEPADRVRQFFYDEMGLTFIPLLDEGGQVADLYGVFNFPSTFFVDRNGVVAAVHRGPLVQSQIEENLETIVPVSQSLHN